MNPCEQADKIAHITKEMEKADKWREDTSEVLSDISIRLATLDERLKQKLETFETHVKEGAVFRSNIANTTLGLVVTLTLAVIGAVYAYGGIANQVNVNTARWDRLLQSEVHKDIK